MWMTEKQFKKLMREDFQYTDIEDFEEYYEANLQAREEDGAVKYENGKLYIKW